MGLVTRIGYPIDASANFLLASEPQNGQSRVESYKSALEALAVQHQQDQGTLEESITQSTTELQNAITALDAQLSLVNTNLLAFMRKALQDQAEQLREEFTRQFRWASLTGFIGWVIALGTLAVVLR
jgi:hypothetical protein